MRQFKSWLISKIISLSCWCKERLEVESQVDDLKVEIETAYYDQLAKAVQVGRKLRVKQQPRLKKRSSLLIKDALQKMKIRKPFCVM